MHPYTEVLLASVPRRDRQHRDAQATPPAQARPARGCPFQLRCPRKLGAICETETPPWREKPDGGGLLCHIPLDDLANAQAPYDKSRQLLDGLLQSGQPQRHTR